MTTKTIKMILQDKIMLPGVLGIPSPRWLYSAERESVGGQTTRDPHYTLMITPAEFRSLDTPGVLYVTVSGTAPEPEYEPPVDEPEEPSEPDEGPLDLLDNRNIDYAD